MTRTIGRLHFLFLILVFGGIAVSLFRAPILLVAVYVLVKTASDLAAHTQDHRQ